MSEGTRFRCMACDRPFTYPGVSPVQVGGCFYHPGCQPVAFVANPVEAPVVTTAGEVSGHMYGPTGPFMAGTAPVPAPHGSICPLHPEVVLEGGEACFKCCAWGVPE